MLFHKTFGKAHPFVEFVARLVLAGHDGKGVIVALHPQQLQQGGVQALAQPLADAIRRAINGSLHIPGIGLAAVPGVGAGKALQAAVRGDGHQKRCFFQHTRNVGGVLLGRGKPVLESLGAMQHVPVVQLGHRRAVRRGSHADGDTVVRRPLCRQGFFFSLGQFFDGGFAL